MKRRLVIEIDAGETACVNEDAEWKCQYLSLSWFGYERVCTLFDDGRGPDEKVLCEVGGNPQRCDECLRAEVKP